MRVSLIFITECRLGRSLTRRSTILSNFCMDATLHILMIAGIWKDKIVNSSMRVWLLIVSLNSNHSAEKLIINKDQGTCITLWFWSYSWSLEIFACLRMSGSGSYLEYKVFKIPAGWGDKADLSIHVSDAWFHVEVPWITAKTTCQKGMGCRLLCVHVNT